MAAAVLSGVPGSETISYGAQLQLSLIPRVGNSGEGQQAQTGAHFDEPDHFSSLLCSRSGTGQQQQPSDSERLGASVQGRSSMAASVEELPIPVDVLSHAQASMLPPQPELHDLKTSFWMRADELSQLIESYNASAGKAGRSTPRVALEHSHGKSGGHRQVTDERAEDATTVASHGVVLPQLGYCGVASDSNQNKLALIPTEEQAPEEGKRGLALLENQQRLNASEKLNASSPSDGSPQRASSSESQGMQT